jgi:Lipocalin-like domain
MRREHSCHDASFSLVPSRAFLGVPEFAQSTQKSIREQIVGAWMVVGCEIVQPDGTKSPLVNGDNPVGQFIFTDNGRFAFQVSAESPKIASNDSKILTPEESQRVAEGTIAYFGTYTLTAGDKTIAVHIERSSISNLNGTDGGRIITSLSTDEMNWTNPARLDGGVIHCTKLRARP